MKKIILIFLICFAFLSACKSDEECRKNRYINLIAGMYHSEYNDTKGTYDRTALNIDSLTLRGIKLNSNGQEVLVDSILYNNSKMINKLALPLQIATQESKYLAVFNNAADTITIFHTNYDVFLSLECGCIKTFTIDTVLTTHNFIDSVKITNHNVTNIDAENIQIFN